MMKTTLTTATLTTAAGALALALAAPVLGATLPQPKTEHGVTYLSGGIGKDEAAAMKAEAKNYPLSLVFSRGKDNEYAVDVSVAIKNRAGKPVLDAASAGPILLVRVPAGRYRIVATSHGKALQRAVLVKAKGDRQIVFHWPAA